MSPPPPRKPITLDDVPGAPQWLEKVLAQVNSFILPAGAALDRGLSYRENFAGVVTQMDLTVPDEWLEVPLANGFSQPTGDNQPFQVRKDLDGWVSTRGVLVRSGSAPAAGTLISELAPGLHPAAREVFPTYTEAPSALGSVSVSPAGLAYENGNTGATALSGLTWHAADPSPARWSTPVTVRLGTKDRPFQGRPGFVQVLRASEKGVASGYAVVAGLDWDPVILDAQTRLAGVRLHRVWGLRPRVSYTLTLLVLPE